MASELDSAVFRRLLQRPEQSHKYDFGHVLIIGGSPGMTGASLLAGKAALRSGAGLVTLAAQPQVADRLAGQVPELMTLAFDGLETLQQFVSACKANTLVIGPGLMPGPDEASLLQWLLTQKELTLVIDGGALTILSDYLDDLDSAACRALILTPHSGEFARLTGGSLPGERAPLKPIASQFAKQHKVIVVLKGNPTFVCDSSGQLVTNPTGNPGLATAGSGDVLSGIIGAMVAQGIEPYQAAVSGVYLHGLAGDLAAASLSQPAMMASDIIDYLPAAFRQVAKRSLY